MPSVRTTVRFALAAAAVLATVAGPASADPPADQAPPSNGPACPLDGSTTVYDNKQPGDLHSAIAYYQPAPDQTYVCIQALGDIQTVAVVSTAIAATPPNVQRAIAPSACSVPILQGRVTLSAGYDPSTSTLCLEVGGRVATFQVAGPTVNAVPSVAVWVPANTTANRFGYCAPEFVAAQRHKDDPSRKDAWTACYSKDNRLI